MRIGLLAEKIGMSRFYDSDMVNHAVTLLQVRDCKIVSIKNFEKHGYNAVTLSHGTTKKPSNKPFKGFLKKNNLQSFCKSNEFRVDKSQEFKLGDNVEVSNFTVGQYVDVSSNSIGKGFAGGMKRHNFSGNRATHGVSISHRSHGSTGQCQDPGKVFKGKKMAGRLGNKKITVQNLKVLKVDIENNLLVVKGAIPGHKGSIIRIVDAIKKKQDIKPAPIEAQGQASEVNSDQHESSTPVQSNEKLENKTNEVEKKISNQPVIEKKNDDNSSNQKPDDEPNN